MAICDVSDNYKEFNKEYRRRLAEAEAKQGVAKATPEYEIQSRIDRDWDIKVREYMTADEVKMLDYVQNAYPDGQFLFNYRNSKKQGKFKTLALDITDSTVTIYGPKQTYTFSDGNTRSEPTSSGAWIDAPVMENIHSQMKALGTTEGYSRASDDSEYEKLQGDFVNNPEKAKELALELAELDGTMISEEHKKRLLDVIDGFVSASKKFIPDMHVYLNKQAKKNGGAIEFGGPNKGIYIGVSDMRQKAGNEMSAMEAYVHEIVHAATEYAKEQRAADVAPVMSRIRKLHKQAIEVMTWEDLVPEQSVHDPKLEKEIAQKMLKYMTSEVGLSEFIAHGLTNEKVMQKLNTIKPYKDTKYGGKTFIDRLMGLVFKLYDAVMRRTRLEDKNISGDELLAKLALQLAEANNLAYEKKRAGIVDKASNALNTVNRVISNQIKKIEARAEKSPFPKLKPGSGRIGATLFTLRNFGKLMMDGRTRGFLENMLSEIGLKPEGTAQTIMRGFREQDGLQRVLEKVGLRSGQIDQRRQEIERSIGKMILTGFKKKPSRLEQEALSVALVDVDLSSVYNDYSSTRMKNILRKDSTLQGEIDNLRRQIKKMAIEGKIRRQAANFYLNQAAGLGYYMATHQGQVYQLLNAENIAKKINTSNKIDTPADGVVELIDKLATLEGLKYTPQDAKNILADLIDKDANGVFNVSQYHKLFKEQSDQALFGDDKKINKIKGYAKEIFDTDITIQIAPLSKKKDMLFQGFDVAEVLPKDQFDKTKERLAIYINKDHMTQSYNRVGMRFTDMNRKGTSVKDIHHISNDKFDYNGAKLEIDRLNILASKEIAKMEKGIIEPDKVVEGGRIPILDADGKAIDFRYMMSKSRKAKLLGQDIKAPRVLGRMFASIEDKLLTKEFNMHVLDIIEQDMEDNYTGSKYGINNREYVKIDPKSHEKDVREIWKIIPKTIKKELHNRAVQRLSGQISTSEYDLTQDSNGATILVYKNSGKKVPDNQVPEIYTKINELAVRRDLLYSYFGFRDMSIVDTKLGQHLPKIIKHVVRVAEMMWREIVKVAKVDIIIRTPAVLIGNVISNFVLSLQFGMNPLDVAKLQIDGVRELKQYNGWNKRLIQLEGKQGAGLASEKEINEISTLKGYMKSSSVKDLIDAGLWTAIVEDASVEDLATSGRFTKRIDEALDGAPEFVKTGVNYLYITERTAPFRWMTTATQYSDFVARYALYTSLRKRGNSRKKSLETVTDAFINYGAPDSKFIQYMNDMGFVMFTKYFLRIQRVIATSAKDHPVNLLLSILGQQFLTGDIDDITDQSIFTKNYSGVVHSPWENFLHAVIPTTGEFAYEAYRAIK